MARSKGSGASGEEPLEDQPEETSTLAAKSSGAAEAGEEVGALRRPSVCGCGGSVCEYLLR